MEVFDLQSGDDLMVHDDESRHGQRPGEDEISAIPPDAVPYMTGEYIMNTDRLKKFLGADYERVIEKTNFEAFADSFQRN